MNLSSFLQQYFVYIMTNKPNGVLYVGITNDLINPVYQHKNNLADGFTKKYHLHRLIYYENTNDVYEAIAREKRLKKWHRQWKIDLINQFNPSWADLYNNIIG
jgi:putative endonuclease